MHRKNSEEFSTEVMPNAPKGVIDGIERKTKGLWRKGWNAARPNKNNLAE